MHANDLGLIKNEDFNSEGLGWGLSSAFLTGSASGSWEQLQRIRGKVVGDLGTFFQPRTCVVLRFYRHEPSPPARLPMTCPHQPDTSSSFSSFAWALPRLRMPSLGSMLSRLPHDY